MTALLRASDPMSTLGQADENPQGLEPGYLQSESTTIALVGVQGRACEASRPWLQSPAQQPSGYSG